MKILRIIAWICWATNLIIGIIGAVCGYPASWITFIVAWISVLLWAIMFEVENKRAEEMADRARRSKRDYQELLRQSSVMLDTIRELRRELEVRKASNNE